MLKLIFLLLLGATLSCGSLDSDGHSRQVSYVMAHARLVGLAFDIAETRKVRTLLMRTQGCAFGDSNQNFVVDVTAVSRRTELSFDLSQCAFELIGFELSGRESDRFEKISNDSSGLTIASGERGNFRSQGGAEVEVYVERGLESQSGLLLVSDLEFKPLFTPLPELQEVSHVDFNSTVDSGFMYITHIKKIISARDDRVRGLIIEFSCAEIMRGSFCRQWDALEQKFYLIDSSRLDWSESQLRSLFADRTNVIEPKRSNLLGQILRIQVATPAQAAEQIGVVSIWRNRTRVSWVNLSKEVRAR